MTADPMWDEVFHGLAFSAFVAEARAVQGWPDSERVRRAAYRLYEDEMAARNAEPAD